MVQNCAWRCLDIAYLNGQALANEYHKEEDSKRLGHVRLGQQHV